VIYSWKKRERKGKIVYTYRWLWSAVARCNSHPGRPTDSDIFRLNIETLDGHWGPPWQTCDTIGNEVHGPASPLRPYIVVIFYFIFIRYTRFIAHLKNKNANRNCSNYYASTTAWSTKSILFCTITIGISPHSSSTWIYNPKWCGYNQTCFIFAVILNIIQLPAAPYCWNKFEIWFEIPP
jgi:hypothetical protein